MNYLALSRPRRLRVISAATILTLGLSGIGGNAQAVNAFGVTPATVASAYAIEEIPSLEESQAAHAGLIACLADEFPDIFDAYGDEIIAAAYAMYYTEVTGEALTPAQLALLDQLKSDAAAITALDCSGYNLGEDLWPLSYFTGLTYLNISGTTAKGLEFLAGMSDLENLVIKDSVIETLDQGVWSELTSLRTIDLTGSQFPLTEWHLSPLAVINGLNIVTDFGVFNVVDGNIVPQGPTLEDAMKASEGLIQCLAAQPAFADFTEEQAQHVMSFFFEEALDPDFDPTKEQLAALALFQAAANQVTDLDCSGVEGPIGDFLEPMMYFNKLVNLNLTGTTAKGILPIIAASTTLEKLVIQNSVIETLAQPSLNWAKFKALQTFDLTGAQNITRASQLAPLTAGPEGLVILTDFGIFTVVDGELVDNLVGQQPGVDTDALFDADVLYPEGRRVFYDGLHWQALEAGRGQVPGELIAEGPNAGQPNMWMEVLEAADLGIDGLNIWNKTWAFQAGDPVTHGGNIWVALQSGLRNVEPSAARATAWQLVSTTVPSPEGGLRPMPQPGVDTINSVERISGPTRFDLAVQVSQDIFPHGADVVYLANGSAPEAVAGAAAAGELGGPVLLIDNNAFIPFAVASEIVRLNASQIVILGGVSSVPDSVLGFLQLLANDVVRIDGANRFQIANNIAVSAFPQGAPRVYVANGNTSDALIGAAVAGALGGPVLLIDNNGTFPAGVIDTIKGLNPELVFVVGTAANAPASVVTRLRAELSAAQVTPITGANQVEVAVNVSKATYPQGAAVAYIANESSPELFPGAAAGANRQGPLLLLNNGQIAGGTLNELKRLQPNRVVVLGDLVSVPESVLQQISEAIGVAVTNPATSMPVFRALNPGNGMHLWTSDRAEYDSWIRGGWNGEGVAWWSPVSGNAVHRVRNPFNGHYLYTSNQSEIAGLVAANWVDEYVAFYSAPATNGVAVYRFRNPVTSTHLLSMHAGEIANLLAAGWINENVAFHALP